MKIYQQNGYNLTQNHVPIAKFKYKKTMAANTWPVKIATTISAGNASDHGPPITTIMYA